MIKKIFSVIFFIFATQAFAKPLTLILDWFVNPDHAPIFVAQQQGYFKNEGIDLKIISPANAADGPKLIAAGKADIAIDYQPQLIMQVAQGLPLVRFGALVNSPLSCLITLKNGPIKTIKDLKGKSVACSPGFSDIMLDTMLKHHGLNINDVKRVSVNYDLVQSLLSHNVAAFTGGMRNFEPIEIKLAGKTPKLFLPEKNGIPPYDELIFVTNKNEIKNPKLIKFLSALKSGVDYLQKHPEKSWLLFAKNHPALNNKLNHEAWHASLKYFAKNPAALNKEKYIHFTNFLRNQGMIKTTMLLNRYAVQLQ